MPGKKNLVFLPAYGLTASLFFLSFIFTHNISAQEYSSLDSLKPGVMYKFTLFDETEIFGKLIKTDSVFVEISNKSVITKIKKDDIFSVSREIVPSKFKFMFALGGGIVFPGGDFFSHYENEFEKSYCFQLAGSFYFSNNKIIRLDLGYSRLNRKDRPNYYYSENYSSSGGDKSLFSFKVDFLAGEFTSESNIIAYGLAGIGLHYTYISEYKYTYTSTWDTTHHTYTYTNPAEKKMNAILSIGGGFGYKIKNKFGVYAEAEYNMVTYAGYVFFGPGTSYFPLKLGLLYFIY